jgi:hypothetical protein
MIIDEGDLGAEGDPLVWFPGAVREELDRTRRVLDQVNSDASRASKAGKISGDEWRQWRDFYVTSHRYTQSASTLTGASVARARTISAEAQRWRDLIAARGVRPSGPAPEKPEDRKLPTWAKWTIGVGVAVSGAWALSTIAGVFRGRRA